MSQAWRPLAVFAERASAEVLARLLRSEAIDVEVRADEPVPGLVRSCIVLVATQDWSRAQRLYRDAGLSDEERVRDLDRVRAQRNKNHKE
jgi:hypothetical protein